MMCQIIGLAIGLLWSVMAMAQAPVAQAVSVITADVELRDMAVRHRLNGTLRARQAVLLRSPVAEQVTQIHFQDGQSVRRGDLLVSLQQAQEQAQLAAAQAHLLEAQAQFQRVSELRKQKLSSQAEWDLARAAVQAAEAAVDEMRAELADRQIKAPFDGVLGLCQISLGDYLSAGAVISQLTDLEHLEVEFELPERLLPLWNGMPQLDISLPAFAMTAVPAKPLADAGQLNPQTRQLMARAKLMQTPKGLRPGQLALVSMHEQSPPTLAVPESALLAREDQWFVFLAEGDRAQGQAVTLGQRRNGWVEISKGLKRGQRVIVHGQSKLRSGSMIAPRGHYDGNKSIADLIKQSQP